MERVATVADATFSAESFTTEFDGLGRSAGMEITEGARMAVSINPLLPVTEMAGQVNVLQIPVLLQLYLAYSAEPDETIVVDPRPIAEFGHRLREAFRTQESSNSPQLWFLRLTQINYPRDPTGNATRLEAHILGTAENPPGLAQS